MTKDKQIEEMAKLVCSSFYGSCYNCPFDFYPPCPPKKGAERLYNAGYRKADGVAREIFEEIEDVLNNIGYFDELDFKALKKKYTEECAK